MLANLNQTVLYTGATNDFTARYGADRLVYFEAYDDIARAIEREKQIKGWSRRKKNVLIAESNPAWDDLWPRIVQ